MHLPAKRVKARKILFVADFFDECAGQALTIYIGCKIEEEDFQMVVAIDRYHRIGAKIGDPVVNRASLDSFNPRHSLEPASYLPALYRKHA